MTSAAAAVVVLVQWALAHLVGAALADALPCSLASTDVTSVALEVVLLVRWALAHMVGAALADALPLFPGCYCFDEGSFGRGGAGAVGHWRTLWERRWQTRSLILWLLLL